MGNSATTPQFEVVDAAPQFEVVDGSSAPKKRYDLARQYQAEHDLPGVSRPDSPLNYAEPGNNVTGAVTGFFPERTPKTPAKVAPYDFQRAIVGGITDVFTNGGQPGNMATPPLGEPMAQGVREMETPGKRGTGALRVAATGAEALTPLMGPAAIENPASILRGLAEGTVASEAGGYGLKKAGMSPENVSNAKALLFWAPGVARAVIDPKLAVESASEGTRAGVTVAGGRAGVGVQVTPEGVTVAGKVGSFQGSKTFSRSGQPTAPGIEPPTIEGQTAPDPTATLIAEHNLVQQRAGRVAQGLPPVDPQPAPPPISAHPDAPASVQKGSLSADDVSEVAQLIAKLPQDIRAQAMQEAHGTLAKVLLEQGQRGPVVLPNGQMTLIKDQASAEKAALQVMNDAVKDHDQAQADAAKETQPAKEPGKAVARVSSRQKAAELAAPKFEVVEGKPVAQKLGKNEPASEVDGGGVVENVFGEKTIHASVKDWVESHGLEVRPAGDGYEAAIPWTNAGKGTNGVDWMPFKTLRDARDVLGYGNEMTPEERKAEVARLSSAPRYEVVDSSPLAQQLTKGVESENGIAATADSKATIAPGEQSASETVHDLGPRGQLGEALVSESPSVAASRSAPDHVGRESAVQPSGPGETSGAFQKGDPVTFSRNLQVRKGEGKSEIIPVGTKAFIEHANPGMNFARVRLTDGKVHSVPLRNLERGHNGTEHTIAEPTAEVPGEVRNSGAVEETQPRGASGSSADKSEVVPNRTANEITPGKVGEMKVSDLKVAPHKFQYKLSTDAEGVSPLLKEAQKYNPELAGTISVWRDPADGKTYVVNGHHRWELAKRMGEKTVAVRHVVAKDAVAARAIGATQNIAEGRGTAVDAAKFFRDSGMTPEDLKAKGISLGEATASDGMALSHLDDSLFKRVVSGDLRVGRAKTIGEATSDPAEQKAILSLVERKEARGAKVPDDTLSELIRLVKGSEQTTETTADLFGSQQVTRSLALEKAEISAHIKQQLAKDKKLFGFVAKEGRAEELARADNQINVEKSKEISTQAAQAEEVYNKLSERGGPIGSILDGAARRLADGDNAGTVKADAYTRVRDEVSKTLGGTEERSVGRSERAPEAVPRTEAKVTAPTESELRRPKSASGDEPTLPGMEHVPAERAEANSEQQGKDLTEKLTEPPKSIESKAGEIEQKSPLFRDTEANPQKGLFADESGSLEPGKAATSIANAAGRVGEFLRQEVADNRRAHDLQWDMYDLDKRHEARVLRAKDLLVGLKKDGVTQDDRQAIDEHLDALEADSEHVPVPSLTPKQDEVLDKVLMPMKAEAEEAFKKVTNAGMTIPNYNPRQTKGRGGMLDRFLTPKAEQRTGRGNLLSQTMPAENRRTMMALENSAGKRMVVSLKGGQVTAWENGTPDNLGPIMNTEEGREFLDKDNNIWKLKQATKAEIEKHTNVEYYHDAAASTVVNWLQAKKAEAAHDLVETWKHDPDFHQVAVKTEAGNPPKGWRTTNLPQMKGYYFEPHTAEVLDWFNDRLKSGSPTAFDSINGYMRAKILLNPIKHPMNVGAQWAVDKGVTGFLPHRWLKIGRTGARAVSAVINQNDDFKEALDAGGALQSARGATRDLVTTFYDQMADGAEKGEPWATKLAKSVGMAPVELVKALHTVSSKIAWPASDMMFLQAAYEYQGDHPGVGLHDALREVGRTIPEYRLPTRIMDSPTVAKVMSSNIGTVFGSYHYGLLRSFTENAKSALGGGEPAPGRTKAEEVGKGWDRLALMALGAFGIYAAADQLAKKITGNKDAEVQRHGIFGLLKAAVDVAHKDATPTQAITKVVTPNPATEGVVQLAFNRDLRTGRKLYDPAADWSTQGSQLMQYLKEELLPQGQEIERAQHSDEGWKKFAWGQADVNFPKHGPEKLAQQIASSKMDTSAWTPDERERYYARQSALDGLRKGDAKAFEEGLTKGLIRPEEISALMRRSQGSALYDKVHGFSYAETLKVYTEAVKDKDDDAQRELLPLLLEKQSDLLSHGRYQEAGVQ